MWFEILPSLSIIMVAMAVPHASAYVINKLWTDGSTLSLTEVISVPTEETQPILTFFLKSPVKFIILVTGNMYRRSTINQDLRLQYMRSIRLAGDPYNNNGLESIPDE
ncbi:uncharacterized protein LOC126745292 [Anthonomus grandis grandis]|uniref:uncharacterized protein LOC126745292 n=1 Tax=Anthonomus grandis grandis TaxID=2921223 RepID=UPI0021659B25|nr:uncharacterized protein LOC126745292 [Anthonomus grandis grandis]